MAEIFGIPGKEWGDRQVYKLFSMLPDRYIVYAQPAIHAPSGSRNPDYVILDKSRGILVIEVKDWKYVQPAYGDKAAVLKTQGWEPLVETNPVDQAWQATFVLREALEQESHLINHRGPHRGKTIVPVGHIGILPNIDKPTIRALRKSWGYCSLFGKEEMLSPVLLESRLADYPYMFNFSPRSSNRTIDCIHQLLYRKDYIFKIRNTTKLSTDINIISLN